MMRHAAPLEVDGPAVDTCGTGGDRAHTVNISSMAALVVAGAGVTVVKHGNRAASSSTGSADVLEELGVAVDLPPALVGRLHRARPASGSASRRSSTRRCASPGPTRAQLGVATVFNFLGPLCNPAQPSAQAVGVYDARMAPVMAAVLARRGTSALVFRGDDGLDELSTATTSRVWMVRDGQVHESVLNPVELGIALSPAEALRGGDRTRNAEAVRELLAGEQGPVRDAVRAQRSRRAGRSIARRGQPGCPAGRSASPGRPSALDTGAAAAALDRWVSTSRGLVPA